MNTTPVPFAPTQKTPAIIPEFSTYWGGIGNDEALDFALDKNNNIIHLVGHSLYPHFPIVGSTTFYNPTGAFYTTISTQDGFNLVPAISGEEFVLRDKPFSHEFTVRNVGSDPATNVAMTITVPLGVSQLQNIAIDSSTMSCAHLQDSQELSILCGYPLSPGEAGTVKLTGTPRQDGTFMTDVMVSGDAVEGETPTSEVITIDNSTEFTFKVGAGADISVTQKATPNPVSVGENVTFTVTFSNLGPEVAGTVHITNTLPAHVILQSVKTVGLTVDSINGNTILLTNRFTLRKNSTPFVATIVAQVQGSAGNTIVNSVSAISRGAISNELDPNPGVNDIVDKEVSVKRGADLELDFTVPEWVKSGNLMSYTVSILNKGPEDATNIVLTNTLPASVTVHSIAGMTTNSITSNEVILSHPGTLAKNSTVNATIVISVPHNVNDYLETETKVTGKGAISGENDPYPEGNRSDGATQVWQEANMTLGVFDTPDPISAGQLVTYNITIYNPGPGRATHTGWIYELDQHSLDHPSRLVSVSFSHNGSQCNQYRNDTNEIVLRCGFFTLDKGQIAVASIVMRHFHVGDVSNKFTLLRNVPTGITSSWQDIVEVETTTVNPKADLEISAEGSPDPVLAGKQATFIVEVTNEFGPSDAPNTIVEMPIPADTTYHHSIPVNSPCTLTTVLTCNMGTIPKGGSKNVAIVLNLSPSLSGDLTLSPYIASSFAVDENLSNNTTSETIQVDQEADINVFVLLSSYLLSPPDTVLKGQVADLNIQVSNNGPTDAGVTTVQATLPQEFLYKGSNGYQCSHGGANPGGTVTCQIDNLSSGDTKFILLKIQAVKLGENVSVSASAIAITPDPKTDNNFASDTINVRQGVDIQITQPSSLSGYTNTPYVLDLTVTNLSDATVPSLFLTQSTIVGIVKRVNLHGISSNTSCNSFSCQIINLGGRQTAVIRVVVEPSGLSQVIKHKFDVKILDDRYIDLNTFNNTSTVTINLNGTPPTNGDLMSPDKFSSGGLPASPPQTFSLTGKPTLAVNQPPTQTIEFAPSSDNNLLSGTADLELYKFDSADPVAVNNPLTYTLQAANGGPDTATNVVITDSLPANVTFGSVATTHGSCSHSSGEITCNIGSMTTSDNVVVTVVVTPTTVGFITNYAGISADQSDPGWYPNQAYQDTTVQTPSADLSINKYVGPNYIQLGETSYFQLDVTNYGPLSAENVVISDTLPAGLSYLSASPECTPTGQLVTCNLGTLAGPYDFQTVYITVTANSAGHINNTATVTSTTPDPNLWYNESSATLSVVASDLGISKTDSIDPVAVGQSFVYTLTATNYGPFDASNIVITDTLPAQLSFLSASSGCTHLGSGVVGCDLSYLSSSWNNSTTFTVSVQANSAGTISNTVVVTSDDSDPVLANNIYTETTTISPGADLSLIKTAEPASPTAFQPLTYTLVISNAGPLTATDVVLTDNLPMSMTVASLSAGCSDGGQVVSCTVGSVNAGTISTYTIVVTPTVGGVFTNTATLTASSSDPNAGNNFANVVSTIGAVAILQPASPTSLQYIDENGRATTINFPAGTVTQTTTIVFTPQPEPVFPLPSGPMGQNYVEEAFRLEAYVNGILQPNFQFLQPATITIEYNPLLVDPYNITLRYWDGIRYWLDGKDSCSTSGNYTIDWWAETVSLPICIPSDFALMNKALDKYIINTTNDLPDYDLDDDVCNVGDGYCSLRAALEQIESHARPLASPPAPDIWFDLPGNAPYLIQPSQPYSIAVQAEIDGRSQPGYAGIPLITIDGTNAGNTTHGLQLVGSYPQVYGLNIANFGGIGIVSGNSSNTIIEDNYIGTDIAGTASAGNGTGILLIQSDNAKINNNLISGNIGNGVIISGTVSGANYAYNNVLTSNKIGVDVTGLLPLGNGGNGVLLRNAYHNQIGSYEQRSDDGGYNSYVVPLGNVIAGNSGHGVLITGTRAISNAVWNNLIGVNISNTATIGNNGNGIAIFNANHNRLGGC